MFLPLQPEHCRFLQSTYADQPGKADSELVKIQARCRFDVMVDENKDSWTEEIYLGFARSIMSTDATVTAKAHVGVLGRFTKYAKNCLDARAKWNDKLRQDPFYKTIQKRMDNERQNGFANQLSTFMGQEIYEQLRPGNIRATEDRVRAAVLCQAATGAGMDGHFHA